MHSSFMKDLIEYSGYKPREEKSKKTPTRRKKEEPAAAADAQVQQEGGRETRNRRRTKRYGYRLGVGFGFYMKPKNRMKPGFGRKSSIQNRKFVFLEENREFEPRNPFSPVSQSIRNTVS